MRTKTLLLTAALGVVGAATAAAQVYSVNTVGYVNTPLKKGFNMVGNPLDNKSGNTVGNLFGTALGDGAAIYKFKNGGYEATNGYNEAFGGWDKADQTLVPGEGAFVYLDLADKTVTFVGDVMQGNLVNKLNKGFNMVSSMVPQAGKLEADLGYVPQKGDAVYQFTSGVGYKGTIGYDPDFGGWDDPPGAGGPMIGVGEAFFLYKEAAQDWVRDFTVK